MPLNIYMTGGVIQNITQYKKADKVIIIDYDKHGDCLDNGEPCFKYDFPIQKVKD